MRRFIPNVSLLFTLLRTSYADIDQKIQQSIHGCSFDDPTLTQGFTGTIYQFDHTFNAQNALYDGQYSTQPILGTFFNSDDVGLNIATETDHLSGFHFTDAQFIIEELGYFNGMFYFKFKCL